MEIIDYRLKKEKAVLIFTENKLEIPMELFIVFKIQRGKILTEEEYKELELKSNNIFAKERAINLVSFGMNSEKMLRDKLYKKGYSKLNVEYAIKFCKEYRLIDDYNYAKIYIETYKSKFGSLKLINELKNKGINSKIIDELSDGFDEKDEVTQAMKIGLKYAKKLNLAELKDKQKLMRYLLSKGFKYDIVKEVLKRLKVVSELCEDEIYED